MARVCLTLLAEIGGSQTLFHYHTDIVYKVNMKCYGLYVSLSISGCVWVGFVHLCGTLIGVILSQHENKGMGILNRDIYTHLHSSKIGRGNGN